MDAATIYPKLSFENQQNLANLLLAIEDIERTDPVRLGPALTKPNNAP